MVACFWWAACLIMKTYVIDFEFCQVPGGDPRVWCVAWHCMEDGSRGSEWVTPGMKSPFPDKYCMVAHYAIAELRCLSALGWGFPTHVIDTYAESRVVQGQVAKGMKLLDLAATIGISCMCHEHKDDMRSLAMQEMIPEDRRQELMDYCSDDVETTVRVWRYLEEFVDRDKAHVRGSYLKALAKVECNGIPVDVSLVGKIEKGWTAIKDAIKEEVRLLYPGVIRADGTFSTMGWLGWCESAGIPWPVLESGKPRLDENTFKEMTNRYPVVRVMAYSRKLTGQARPFLFELGDDGRLRCMLSPFGSDTGRNQPPSSKFIFGANSWLRSVIMSPPGKILVYIDFSSQEFALAGGLSGDESMLEDYRSGDPYVAFAVRAGALPEGATKESHAEVRAMYKTVALAVQYGMQEGSLAKKLGCSLSEARQLIESHVKAYSCFWRWRQAVIDTVMCGGGISTPYGWERRLKENDTPNSIANFPVQAAGAEILRVAITALVGAGYKVVAPVHDAVLVEIDENGWEAASQDIRRFMERASTAVVPEINVRTDCEYVMPGKHYVDKWGIDFWKVVGGVIGVDPTV